MVGRRRCLRLTVSGDVLWTFDRVRLRRALCSLLRTLASFRASVKQRSNKEGCVGVGESKG